MISYVFVESVPFNPSLGRSLPRYEVGKASGKIDKLYLPHLLRLFVANFGDDLPWTQPGKAYATMKMTNSLLVKV